MEKSTHIQIRIAPADKAAVDAAAAARGVTVSELIRRYLAGVIARAKPKGDA